MEGRTANRTKSLNGRAGTTCRTTTVMCTSLMRIEYEDRDGRSHHEDIEVVTAHYRGGHAGAVARSGFSCYRVMGGMVGGCASTGRRGGSRHPRLAEELLG